MLNKSSKKSRDIGRRLFLLFCALSVLLLAEHAAMAQEPASTSIILRNNFYKSLEGKTIVFVPMALGPPLLNAWIYTMALEARQVGMKTEVIDPNWSVSAMTQAISAVISRKQKPDILVVHVPNIHVLDTLLKRAEAAGIYVIQINVFSNYKTDAHVGADWTGLATQVAEEIVKQCGKGSGKSGKVAIMQGEMAGDIGIEQTKAILAVFKKHPEIQVVSNQAAQWDANKAYDITSAVLRMHPDLCAYYGYWGTMDLGGAKAVKAAGLMGKVQVYSSGEVTPAICGAIKEGLFTKYWNYMALRQGHDIMTAAKTLLQLRQKPGSLKLAFYSPTEVLTKENVENYNCWCPSAERVRSLLKE